MVKIMKSFTRKRKVGKLFSRKRQRGKSSFRKSHKKVGGDNDQQRIEYFNSKFENLQKKDNFKDNVKTINYDYYHDIIRTKKNNFLFDLLEEEVENYKPEKNDQLGGYFYIVLKKKKNINIVIQKENDDHTITIRSVPFILKNAKFKFSFNDDTVTVSYMKPRSYDDDVTDREDVNSDSDSDEED